jgi:hypothetical protein
MERDSTMVHTVAAKRQQAFVLEREEAEAIHEAGANHRLNFLPFLRKHDNMALNTPRYRDHGQKDGGLFVYGRY